jgi:acyl-homoserine lactone acylase PvdQ
MRLKSPARGIFAALRTPFAAVRRAGRRRRQVLEGLHGKVEVLTDEAGVSYIFADRAQDLFFAQGYVTAAEVNAWIATGARSFEHRVLRWRPEPWREVDSLLLLRAMAFELNVAWRAILFGALLAEAGRSRRAAVPTR